MVVQCLPTRLIERQQLHDMLFCMGFYRRIGKSSVKADANYDYNEYDYDYNYDYDYDYEYDYDYDHTYDYDYN